jgi:hypothetical protein
MTKKSAKGKKSRPATNGSEQIKKAEQLRTVKAKEAVIAALTETCGIVTSACQHAEVGRTQFYKWMKEDPEFAQQVKDIENVALDFVESKLMENIENNDVASVIFFLKTKGKNRGYVERQEVEHDVAKGKRITLEVKADEEV